MLLGEKGKEILYPNPGFPIYESAINLSGAKAVPIELIEDTSFGAWITGLDTISTIITVGQDYVSQGEKVGIALDSRFTDSNERIN